jgi:serine/threonine protein kinase
MLGPGFARSRSVLRTAESRTQVTAYTNEHTAMYQRLHLNLKAQRTILASLLPRLSTTPSDPLAKLVRSLLAADAIGIFRLPDDAIASVREISRLDGTPATVLKALMVVKDLARRLSYARSDPDAPREVVHALPRPSTDATELCRLCETQVPLEFFAEHAVSCLARYKSEEMVGILGAQMTALADGIAHDKLEGREWPAPPQAFSALHVQMLLQRAGRLDPSLPETYDELCSILSVLRTVESEEIALGAMALVNEKRRSSAALTDALHVSRQTSRGSDQRCRTHTISEFEFLKKISRGAFATVFLARKKSTGDIFAIKAIAKKSLTRKNQRRVLSERDMLMTFSDPHVVQFCHFSFLTPVFSITGKQNLYLVTEYLPGGDLYSLLERFGSFGEEEAKYFAFNIVYGLRYLRNHGIVHRDIKPDNILIGRDGRLKLADFGLSKQGVFDWRESADLLTAQSLVGTMDYVAPEILLGQGHSFTADYWSLGAMIWEFIYGVPPFHADTAQETKERVVMGRLPFGEATDDVPVSDEFNDLIKRLLVVDPTKRLGFRSIDEILAHPWFEGVALAEPPFIPHVDEPCDTGYFTQRYEIRPDEDGPILEDIASEQATWDDDMSQFPAVNLDGLSVQNDKVLKTRPPTLPRFGQSASLAGEGPKRGSLAAIPAPESASTSPLAVVRRKVSDLPMRRGSVQRLRNGANPDSDSV